MTFWIFLTALATVVIAVYAWQSHRLTVATKAGEDRFQQQMRDLYRAIVISNIVEFNTPLGAADLGLKTFNQIFEQVREGDPLFDLKKLGLS